MPSLRGIYVLAFFFFASPPLLFFPSGRPVDSVVNTGMSAEDVEKAKFSGFTYQVGEVCIRFFLFHALAFVVTFF
jgi:hypothetical protein